jgi:hypothetical protein
VAGKYRKSSPEFRDKAAGWSSIPVGQSPMWLARSRSVRQPSGIGFEHIGRNMPATSRRWNCPNEPDSAGQRPGRLGTWNRC